MALGQASSPSQCRAGTNAGRGPAHHCQMSTAGNLRNQRMETITLHTIALSIKIADYEQTRANKHVEQLCTF